MGTIFQKNKKIKPEKLFVRASPNAVKRAIKESHDIDEAKLKKLLHDAGIK